MFVALASYGMQIIEGIIAVAALFLLGATGLFGSLIQRVLKGVTQVLWGDISDDELKKFGLLALAFFLLIGSYWMLRVLKDAFLGTLAGFKEYQPIAKMLSPVVVMVSVIFYGKLSDWFSQSRLFWIICVFYTALLFGIGYVYSIIALATVGAFGKFLGVFTYLIIEIFGSIVIAALFWGFVASITKTESAKRGYPVIFLAGQVGNFLGASIVK